MKINYCLPILKNSKQEVLNKIQNNLNKYEYFEVWLDYIEDIDNIFVNEIVNILENKLILLFQRGTTKKRGIIKEKKLEILDLLDNKNCYLDLDISEKEELEYLKKKKLNIKKIISYHNYEETPVNLPEVIKKMETFHPKIYKIATKCINETDALKLLLVQQNFRTQNKSHIILGMGEFGTITRVYGTLWGNELIYAPIQKEEASAPGQLTKHELEKLFSILNTNK